MVHITGTYTSNPRAGGCADGGTDAHDKPAIAIRRLLHEVKGEGTRERDETIIARLGYDQHILNIRLDAGTA